MLAASVSLADHPVGNEGPITVLFSFPNGTNLSTTITNAFEAERIIIQKPLSESIPVAYYKIDWWIYAALRKLDRPFKTETKDKKVTIVEIGDFANGQNGKWVYYVNGHLSPYHINTQLDSDVKTIKFVFKEKRSNKPDARDGL